MAGERSAASILASGCLDLISEDSMPGPQALSRIYEEAVIGGKTLETICAATRVVHPPVMRE